MDLISNRRGFFFMMLTVIILSLFVISATVLTGYAARKSVQDRVSSVTDFVVSVEEDLPRMMFVFGYRAVYLAQGEIIDTGYVSNFSEFFEEAFFNGTINGASDLTIDEILEDSTYYDLVDEFNERGSRLGVEVNFSNPSIDVTQEDPWNLRVTFSANFTASDVNGLVSWNKTMVVVKHIAISNFTDPFYVRNTNGLYNQRIVQTTYSLFSDGADLRDHMENGYYLNSSDAPSFIDRLEGRYNSQNANGIESLVNVEEIKNTVPQEYFDEKSKSMIDFQYFSSLDPPNSQVPGMPSWFRIDSARLVSVYGL
jgi:hypothetical protein